MSLFFLPVGVLLCVALTLITFRSEIQLPPPGQPVSLHCAAIFLSCCFWGQLENLPQENSNWIKTVFFYFFQCCFPQPEHMKSVFCFSSPAWFQDQTTILIPMSCWSFCFFWIHCFNQSLRHSDPLFLPSCSVFPAVFLCLLEHSALVAVVESNPENPMVTCRSLWISCRLWIPIPSHIVCTRHFGNPTEGSFSKLESITQLNGLCGIQSFLRSNTNSTVVTLPFMDTLWVVWNYFFFVSKEHGPCQPAREKLQTARLENNCSFPC